MPNIALTRAFIITPFHLIEDGTILINDTKIISVGPSSDVNVPPDYRELSLEGLIVAPGLIDLHFHGDGDSSVMDGDRTSLEELARFQAVCGVTSFLATTVSAPTEKLLSIANAYAGLQKSGYKGARCLGIHLEGPYISPQFPGNHSLEFIRKPSFEEISAIHRESKNGVRLITMAPELPDTSTVAFSLYKKGIHFSIGHSQADYETVVSAIRAGFSGVTHCFDQLGPLELHDPGVVGAILTIPALWAEINVKERNIHPATLKLLWDTKGVDQILLSSNYYGAELDRDSQKQDVEGETRSTGRSTLDQGVRDLMKLTDCEVTDAFRLATYNPAKRLGINKTKGSLYPGKDADLIVLTPEFEIVMTMVEGQVISGLITL